MTRTLAGSAPHGTSLRFAEGCRSHGGCPHHGSAEFLTCAEAAAARRADYAIARLPAHEPVPRTLTHTAQASRTERGAVHERAATPRVQRTAVEPRQSTTTGYLRGCRRAADCPGGEGGVTCVDARNASRRRAARARGVPPREQSIDVAAVANRIRHLAAEGRSLREIAGSCGVGRTTVAGIAGGTVRRVNPATFSRLVESLGPR